MNHKVKLQIPGCIEQTSYVKKDKCAFPDEIVAVVWMLKKGRNGRGAYMDSRYCAKAQAFDNFHNRWTRAFNFTTPNSYILR